MFFNRPYGLNLIKSAGDKELQRKSERKRKKSWNSIEKIMEINVEDQDNTAMKLSVDLKESELKSWNNSPFFRLQ